MPSSSDYILAKKIIAIKKNVDLISSLDNKNCYNNCNSTVIGSDCGIIGPQGPPGEPGDRYLTTFKDTIHKYVLDTGSISVQIEPGLAYIHGQRIICIYDTSNPPYDSFCGTVFNYDKKTGVMIINNINNISEEFIYSTERTYKLSIDTSSNNNNQLAFSIALDSQSNPSSYSNLTQMSDGALQNAIISNNMTFSPTTGELTVNTLYETTNNSTRINVEPLEIDYSLHFIRSLSPKKYSFPEQPTVSRFGFLAEDINYAHEDEQLGLVNNNAICYSEIIAPIVSVLNTVIERLDKIEERISKLEEDSRLSSVEPIAPLATNYDISSSEPSIAHLSAPSENDMSASLNDISSNVNTENNILPEYDTVNNVNIENNILPEYDTVNNAIEIAASQIVDDVDDDMYSNVNTVHDFIHLINQAKQNYSYNYDITSLQS